jgi:hypothetical protein
MRVRNFRCYSCRKASAQSIVSLLIYRFVVKRGDIYPYKRHYSSVKAVIHFLYLLRVLEKQQNNKWVEDKSDEILSLLTDFDSAWKLHWVSKVECLPWSYRYTSFNAFCHPASRYITFFSFIEMKIRKSKFLFLHRRSSSIFQMSHTD